MELNENGIGENQELLMLKSVIVNLIITFIFCFKSLVEFIIFG